jgi:hypothetical protein
VGDVLDLEFEWDEEKNKLNKKKHGISFETAQMVFQDPYRIEFYDDENSKNEQRYDVIGMVNDMLFVVYTERVNKIRLISARLATNLERRIYDDYNNNIITRR